MLLMDIVWLLLALLVILAGAELFTNALEHVGERFSLSEGLVGSVFAAVATALPETVVPIIAVFFGGTSLTAREHIGVGAILGSPLMLASLAMLLIGLAAGSKRGWRKPLQPEISGLVRDLLYFLVAFFIGFLGLFMPQHPAGVRALAGFTLVFLYVMYVVNTVRASALLVQNGHGTAASGSLWLKRVGIPHTPVMESVQLLLGLAGIVGGAKLFVYGVGQVADLTGVSVLVLSLLIIPVATEMPEKLNSMLWIRRGKDTLAFGNITGALVFQGALLPAFGMQLSAWQPDTDIVWAMGLTFAAILWVLLLAVRRRLTPLLLLLNGLVYLAFFLMIR
ncbi:MAG TPA: sodium:calcium antiporter [Gammaproteobacteria bacterium]|nr:sodium:calcium antiporter [Gammaproteobacteria bacterium]